MICMKMKIRPASVKRNKGLREREYQRSRILLVEALFIILWIQGRVAVIQGEQSWFMTSAFGIYDFET